MSPAEVDPDGPMPANIGERLRRVAVIRACCQLEIAGSVLLVALEELEKLPGTRDTRAELARLEVLVDGIRGRVLDQFAAR